MCLDISKCSESKVLRSLFIQPCRRSLGGFGHSFVWRIVPVWGLWRSEETGIEQDFLASSFLLGLVENEHYGASSEGQVAVPLLLSIHQLSEKVWRWRTVTLCQLPSAACMYIYPWPWESFTSHPSFCHFLSPYEGRLMRMLRSSSTSAGREEIRSCSDSSTIPPLSPLLLQYFYWSIQKALA